MINVAPIATMILGRPTRIAAERSRAGQVAMEDNPIGELRYVLTANPHLVATVGIMKNADASQAVPD